VYRNRSPGTAKAVDLGRAASRTIGSAGIKVFRRKDGRGIERHAVSAFLNTFFFKGFSKTLVAFHFKSANARKGLFSAHVAFKFAKAVAQAEPCHRKESASGYGSAKPPPGKRRWFGMAGHSCQSPRACPAWPLANQHAGMRGCTHTMVRK